MKRQKYDTESCSLRQRPEKNTEKKRKLLAAAVVQESRYICGAVSQTAQP